MIRFTVWKSGRQYRGFAVEGHADYAEEDRDDIICAAVSALTVTTANAIETFTDDSFEQEFGEDGGLLRMRFPEGLQERASLLMDAMLLGIESIRTEYGEQYLTLKIEEV